MLSGNVAWIKGKNNTATIALFIARILKAKLNALQHFNGCNAEWKVVTWNLRKA
jgi:hypothetical protein